MAKSYETVSRPRRSDAMGFGSAHRPSLARGVLWVAFRMQGTGNPPHRAELEDGMESQLRDAKSQTGDVPNTLKEQIVLEHTPLIRYIVNRIAVRLPSHIDLDDLHNTGVIGLMDAIEKYDPDKNCKFKTYAEFRIKGAILDQLRSLDWVPRSVRQKGRRLERAYGEVEQRLGRSATEDEVADSLGLQLDKLQELVNQVRGISLVNLEEIRTAGRRATAPAATPTWSRTSTPRTPTRRSSSRR